jgi:hypothetical protein
MSASAAALHPHHVSLIPIRVNSRSLAVPANQKSKIKNRHIGPVLRRWQECRTVYVT